MTVYSQNGYPANDRTLIHSVLIPGTDVKVAVRIGPVGDLLVYAAARWHREVEPLRAPDGVLDAWGYAERTVRGSSTALSNHASGTAIDLRARAHPLGTDPARNFTGVQVSAIHRILADTRGAIRWGGDYADPTRGGVTGSRPDGMHIETVVSEARCATVLTQLTSTPVEDDLTPDQDAMLRAIYHEATLRLANRRGTADTTLPGAGDDTVLGWAASADGAAFRVESLLREIAARPSVGGASDLSDAAVRRVAVAVIDELAKRATA